MGAPDKPGNRSVALPPPRSQSGHFVEDQEFAALQPFLEELRTAGVNVSMGS